MARLSVEHYRANANMTPDHGRKSSRFRDIFKSRSSLSPSTASIADKSTAGPSSPPPPISPTAPVKHGFEKIGLLPSERSSLLDVQCELENHGGARVAEVLKIQGEGRKSVDVPHNLDTTLSDTGVLRVKNIVKQATKNQQSPEANVIADALKNTLLDRQDILDNKDVPRNGTASLRQLQMGKGAELSRSSSLVQENGKNLSYETTERSSFCPGEDESIDHNDSKDGDTPTAHVLKKSSNPGIFAFPARTGTAPFRSDGCANYDGDPKIELREDQNFEENRNHPPKFTQPESMFGLPNAGVFAPRSGTFLEDTDDEGYNEDTPSFPEPSLSNIFDRNDAFARGIREYVASKVAEALTEHDRQQGKYTDRIAHQQLDIVFHVHMSAPTAGIRSVDTQAVPRRKNIFEGQKTILTLPLQDEKLARLLQILVLGCYIGAAAKIIMHSPVLFVRLLIAVFFFLTIGNAIKADEQALQLGDNNGSTDVLLAPVNHALDLLQEKTRMYIRMAMIAVLTMLVQVLQGVAESVKVDVKTA